MAKIIYYFMQYPRRKTKITMTFLCGVIILLIYHRCVSLDMIWCLSPRYWSYAMPALFSEWYYGAMPYTYYSEVAAHFFSAYPYNNYYMLQIILDTANHLLKYQTWSVMLFPGDEKGTVDLVRFAFLLFGSHVESIFYFCMSVLFFSITFFILRFRHDRGILLIGALALVSIYVALGAFAMTKEIQSITNPRAIGCLSIFALLHLSLLTIKRERLMFWHVFEILFQAVLIVFVISIRTAEIWQIIALGVITLLSARSSVHAGKINLVLFIPLVTVLVLLAGYYQFQNHTYPKDYFTHQLRNKIFWHNVLIGFALNPEFARTYKLDISDGSVLDYIKHFTKNDRRATYQNIFWQDGENSAGMVKNFYSYELECKRAVWNIIQNNKYQTVKLFVYYKPMQLLHSLRYAIGPTKKNLAYYNLSDQSASLMSAEQRTKKSAFFDPFSRTSILIITIGLWITGREAIRKVMNSQILIILVTICVSSLIPAFLTYPLIHLMSDFYITSAMLLYVSVIFFGRKIWSYLRSRSRLAYFNEING